LKKGESVLYPVHHNTIKEFEVANGSSSATAENLFTGAKPRRVLIGLVDTEAINGDPAKNPYNFENVDVSKVKVPRNGLCQ
jgi:hypothetical protein